MIIINIINIIIIKAEVIYLFIQSLTSMYLLSYLSVYLFIHLFTHSLLFFLLTHLFFPISFSHNTNWWKWKGTEKRNPIISAPINSTSQSI